jgi:hypothetical protein
MEHAGEEVEAGMEEAVKVFVRIRPLNKRELGEKQTIGWDFNETSMLEDTQNGQRVYAYDHCFGPDGTNKETYDIVGKPVVLKAMEGYNGTVFTCKPHHCFVYTIVADFVIFAIQTARLGR